MHTPRILRQRLQRLQHQQRHDHRARPIAHLAEMNRKPARQEDQLGRHAGRFLPRAFAIERQLDAGEDIGLERPAGFQDRLARPRHMRSLRGVADHLEREIGFDRRADIEGAVVEQRPAAMLAALDAAQIDTDLALQLEVRLFAKVMDQQHIFGRDGGVGFQLEHPVAVLALLLEQRCGRIGDHLLDRFLIHVQNPIHARKPVQPNAIIRMRPRAPIVRPCGRSGWRPRWWRAGRYRSSRRPG